jgi:hypothetical protein
VSEPTDHLDQAFTSAAYAMLFAIDQWDEFSAFILDEIGRLPPINRTSMAIHIQKIILLTDPDRMS